MTPGRAATESREPAEPARGRARHADTQGTGGDGQPPRRRQWRRSLTRLDMKYSPYALVTPFFVLFGIFGFFPLIYTVWVSFHDWNLIGTGEPSFIGLANYWDLFGNPYFWNAVQNTFGIFLISTIPQLLAALVIAELLNRKLRGRTFFRMGILVPFVVATTTVAIVFKQLFGEQFGLINYVIGLVGLDAISWQSDRLPSWIAIATMVNYRWTGYMALIYLAAMQAIPRTLYEAAEIDGASSWRRFWTITIPMLRPTLIFTVILATVGNMQLVAEPKLFDPAPATSTGGSGRQFQTLQLLLYEVGFENFDFGEAAAIGWMLFFLIIILAVLNYLVTRRVRSS